MATIKPFSCIRPEPTLATQIASGPHSAMSSEEIRKKIERNPLSYTRIVHPKMMYSERLRDADEPYRGAAANLEQWIREGVMIDDREEAFYLYRLEADGHVQTGLVGRIALDDITSNRVRAHENVRDNKLKDLAHHTVLCRAQVGGPILMAYPEHDKLQAWIREASEREPLVHFLSENGVWNTIWRIHDPDECAQLCAWGEEIPAFYISDGHHRIMSSLKICQDMRKKYPDYTGREPWNYVTFTAFAADELKILPYGRLVTDVQKMSREEILEKIREHFDILPLEKEKNPEKEGEFVMLMEGQWFLLTLHSEERPEDVPAGLDVALLQDKVLYPIFGIRNEKRDSRLEFIGGEDQIGKMKERCAPANMAGFLLYPPAMREILRVADAGAIMPSKSTWFTPKLNNGLFIYRICDGDESME